MLFWVRELRLRHEQSRRPRAPAELGRLEHVDPRTVWVYEAHDFTPWLVENADRLSGALGIDLELESAEHAVGHLVTLPRPGGVPPTRLPFERRIYSIVGAVTLVRREADQDLHIVVEADGSHMIVEAPNAPTCAPNATAYRRRQMAAARRAARVCPRARVAGVAFWDYYHRQTGVAPNAIELHPILGFACLA